MDARPSYMFCPVLHEKRKVKVPVYNLISMHMKLARLALMLELVIRTSGIQTTMANNGKLIYLCIWGSCIQPPISQSR